MKENPPKLTRKDTEAKFQKEVIKWLKHQGCWVMKITPMPGIPDGTADIFFCREGFYGFLECKKSRTAERRPGQEQFIQKMAEWSYGRVIYPENWEETTAELGEMLK